MVVGANGCWWREKDASVPVLVREIEEAERDEEERERETPETRGMKI